MPDARAEMEPCPFCGSAKTTDFSDGAGWVVICDDCAARGPCEAQKVIAIYSWNKRAGPVPTTPALIKKQFDTLRAAAAIAGFDLTVQPFGKK